METWFHVSSAANRDSIRVHGLDWTRMGAARGIAGSTVPEADGVFLCPDEFTVGFFARMNNTGGPVDVWAVSGIDKEQMLDNGSGFFYFPGRISAGQVTLIELASADAAPSDTPSRVKRKQKKKTPRTQDDHHSRRRRLPSPRDPRDAQWPYTARQQASGRPRAASSVEESKAG